MIAVVEAVKQFLVEIESARSRLLNGGDFNAAYRAAQREIQFAEDALCLVEPKTDRLAVARLIADCKQHLTRLWAARLKSTRA